MGYEALSRFVDGDPEAVFAQAHRDGRGPELEAAAIEAAIGQRPAGAYLWVNVSVGALVSDEVRAVLPTDLTGVVLEITEQTDTDDWDVVMAVIGDYRARGALVAIDDWGRGYSNVERIMRLRPEVVKLDRSLLGETRGRVPPGVAAHPRRVGPEHGGPGLRRGRGDLRAVAPPARGGRRPRSGLLLRSTHDRRAGRDDDGLLPRATSR